MKSMHELVQPPQEIRAVGMFAAANVALIFVLAIFAHNVLQRVESAEIEMHRLSATLRSALPAQTVRTRPALQPKLESLNRERNFAWNGILEAVESAASADIGLTTFRFEKNRSVINLGGIAKDEKSLLIFLTALTKERHFRQVRLKRQQKELRTASEGILFEVQANLV